MQGRYGDQSYEYLTELGQICREMLADSLILAMIQPTYNIDQSS